MSKYGSYVTYTLIGAAIGFFIGAFVANRKQEMMDQEELEILPAPKKEKKIVKKAKPSSDLGLTESELKQLTNVQLEMVRTGVITADQVRESILSKSTNEIITYAGYKPDLDELPNYEEEIEDELVAVDLGGWEVSVKPPSKERFSRTSTLVYDQQEGIVYRKSRTNLLPFNNKVPEEVFDRVITMFSDLDVVWVLDTKGGNLYKVEEVSSVYAEFDPDPPPWEGEVEVFEDE